MFVESVSAAVPSSLWASMASWFTPSVLFLLLNLVIGTIALTSTLYHHNDTNDPKIARSPSILHRLKSINPYTHYSRSHQEQPSNALPQPPQPSQVQETETHLVSEEKDPILDDFEEDSEVPSMDEIYSQLKGAQFGRTKSDTEPSGGAVAPKLAAKMKKSASSKSAFGHFEEEIIVEARRPATVRERGSAKVTDCDEEVDAKADDFINRFKQQLKLQRLDSIIRYKNMLGRGTNGDR